jgi:hypothetical protein
MRTSEMEAETKVKTGFWAYAPKSEYKSWKKGGTTEEPQSTEETTTKIKVKKKN